MNNRRQHGLPTRRGGLFAILYLLRLALLERVINGYRNIGASVLIQLLACVEHAVLEELLSTLLGTIEAIRCCHELLRLGHEHVAEQLGIGVAE